MCSYLIKGEDQCSKAMKQVFEKAIKSRASYFEEMKSVAFSYASRQECSLEEAIYHIIPELWLRKIYPGVANGNSNIS